MFLGFRAALTQPRAARTPSDAAPAVGGPGVLGRLLRAHRRKLGIAYALVTAENLLQLAQPWALGYAINDLLRSSSAGLLLLVALYVAHLVVGCGRRMYDARAFTRIYAQLASGLVLDQLQHGVAVSRVAARSALSREFVQFFQVYLPLVLQALYCLVGALAMLCCYDWALAALCLALIVPAGVANAFYSRKVLRLNAALHDELEREVQVISDREPRGVRSHYGRVSFWRIRLADSEAVNFAGVELFVIALLAVALLRSCAMPGGAVGDIVAIFRYVILFITSLDSLPVLIQHISRLRDVGRRTHSGTDGSPSGGAEEPSAN